MPGLQFQDLPATQQNPMNMLQNRLGQSEQYLESQYNTELNSLKNQRLPIKNFHNRLNSLNTKYQNVLDQERNKVRQQVQSIQQIQTLMESGQIASGAGQEAIWRMVLPQETERAMFQREQRPTGASFSPSMLRQHEEVIDAYMEEIPRQRLWFTGAAKEPRKQEDLIQSYMNWQNRVGYKGLNLWQRQQLDYYWDTQMLESEGFNEWWKDKARQMPVVKVRALRTTGRIAGAMREKVVGMTPIGRSLIKEKKMPSDRLKEVGYGRWGSGVTDRKTAPTKPQQRTIRQRNRRTGEERISYDGGVTWQKTTG